MLLGNEELLKISTILQDFNDSVINGKFLDFLEVLDFSGRNENYDHEHSNFLTNLTRLLEKVKNRDEIRELIVVRFGEEVANELLLLDDW